MRFLSNVKSIGLNLAYDNSTEVHCVKGDASIRSWSDGSNANYGNETVLAKCKYICNNHIECAGFVHRKVDSVCGQWKRGPLKPWSHKGHDCYEKAIGMIFKSTF